MSCLISHPTYTFLFLIGVFGLTQLANYFRISKVNYQEQFIMVSWPHEDLYHYIDSKVTNRSLSKVIDTTL